MTWYRAVRLVWRSQLVMFCTSWRRMTIIGGRLVTGRQITSPTHCSSLAWYRPLNYLSGKPAAQLLRELRGNTLLRLQVHFMCCLVRLPYNRQRPNFFFFFFLFFPLNYLSGKRAAQLLRELRGNMLLRLEVHFMCCLVRLPCNRQKTKYFATIYLFAFMSAIWELTERN